MSKFFPEPYEPFDEDIIVTVDLFNYVTKTDLKNRTYVNTSSFASKTNLANLKTEIDKSDIDKLVPVPTDLSKFSNVVENDVVKKDVYDKLIAKVNSIDTNDFALRTKYQTDKTEYNSVNQKTKFLILVIQQQKQR